MKTDFNAQEILIILSWILCGTVSWFFEIDVNDPRVYWRLVGMALCTTVVFGLRYIKI